jgi:hypothetical protein
LTREDVYFAMADPGAVAEECAGAVVVQAASLRKPLGSWWTSSYALLTTHDGVYSGAKPRLEL